MKLTVTIDLDNAAFEDDPNELPRLLEKVGERFRHSINGIISPSGSSISLQDINGNYVGIAKITGRRAR